MSQSVPQPPYAGTRPPRPADVPAFTDGIARGWAPVEVPVPLPAGAAAAAAAHRRRLAARTGARTVVAGAGRAPVRSNDTAYDFRADSDFVWLTGCAVEDAVLVLRAGGGPDGDHEATLFVPPPARPGDPGFFSDAAHGELWVGASPDPAAWSRALGIAVRPLSALDEALSGAAGAWATPGTDPGLVRRHGLHGEPRLAAELSGLRMVKDDWEIEQLRHAVDHTVDGFAAVVAEIPAAVARGGERWLQGTFDRHARTVGNGPGYATIVGSGPHAPTLHWVRCDGPVLPDEPLLLDMGVETRSLYTADITRTVPPGGRFTETQRQVHDLVEAAHRAGMARVGPGRRYSDFHFAAMEVIARGLHDWGLLPVSVDEALSPAGQQHRRYLVCGIGHHLGLDVHDCASADYEAYQGATLETGMVLTVEPGLYFHAHDLTVPPELRGIGIRLEDDLLVTGEGSDVLSSALPIAARELETWVAGLTGRPHSIM
ncbi:aminopeptidase P family protein [Streptomyces sp. MP131-18]|uniref:aminopeptidase P family protein n=1 Tax=Streptomyces sp. MP131-18 TaxID=1857892 RepID=UPI00097BB57C|nr:aminopeptidase P family protein [Streptomyces sp. MP131-18]ONK16129.1 Xaa-Pro aminopeptidase 1 [Streptomyces sp. MP131-18]